jgi:hypothetical protein
VFGRRWDSLQEIIRCESSSLRELIREHHEEDARQHEEAARRHDEAAQEDMRRHEEDARRHEEFMRLMEKREEESREEARRRDEEFRGFMREDTLRHEKIFGPMIAQMEEGRREMEEGRKQIRADTEAVLRLLDRFDDAPGGAPA